MKLLAKLILLLTVSNASFADDLSEYQKCVLDYEIWADEYLNGKTRPVGKLRARIALQPIPWLQEKYSSLQCIDVVKCTRNGAKKSNRKLVNQTNKLNRKV